MARLIICFTFVFFGLLVNSFAASGGGQEGSGGGNVENSSDFQVRNSIMEIPNLASSFAQSSYELGLINYENIVNQEVKAAVAEIFGLPKWRGLKESTVQMAKLQQSILVFNPVFNKGNFDLRNENLPARVKNFIILSADGKTCPVTDNVSASTYLENDSPICFNIADLKKLPPASLRFQLLGLFFHELTHQYGYGEEIARAVQSVVLKAYANLEFSKGIASLRRDLAGPNHKSDILICSKVGGLQILAESAQIAPQSTAGKINSLVSELSKNCSGDQLDRGSFSFVLGLLDADLKSQ